MEGEMKHGASILLIAGCIAGCQSSPNALEVRALGDPAARLRGANSLAEAHVQLALGNAGLALEGFRKALRTDGESADALAGIAACYATMGRFDLSRSNYEAALALDPHNPQLLLALARTLDTLGQSAEAADARADASKIVTASSTTAPSSTVTVPLPPARSQAAAQLEAFGSVSPVSRSSAAGTKLASSVTSERPSLPAQGLGVRSPARAERGGGRSATAASSPQQTGPRLERVSPGEVALLTTSAPMWKAQLVSRTRTSTTVRWVPVQEASARPNIRLLNAARSAGIAARARDMLLDRGWRKIEIGNAQASARQTVVIYPANRAALGRSLAAQFNCGSRRAADGDVLLVLLGRDRAGANVVHG
jgi:hypothetical protein